VGIMAEVDAKIAQAFDMSIALNRRLDRIEAVLAYLAAYQNEQAIVDVGEFLSGAAILKQEARDLLYKGKKVKD